MRHQLIGNAIGFVLIAAAACYFTGPVGVFYAAGFMALYWLSQGLAALLNPKTFAQTKPAKDSE